MIDSLEDLKKLALEKRDLKRNSHEELRVCIGSSCSSLGSEELLKDLKKSVSENEELEHRCKVKGVGCNGLCSEAIMVSHYHKVGNRESIYSKIEASSNNDFIETLKSGSPIKDKKCDLSQAFFTRQKKIVLENAGVIDPDDIDDYIAYDGYLALYTALDEMRPEDVLNEIKISGLRGRGGGGYPTGLKWESVSKVNADQKYIVCNGDEGDPGAFMDRAIMEADPHKIIEGMALAGYACGATKGYIYVRAEYPIAVEKLNRAIKQARQKGILGNQIADSGFSFDVEVRLGGGAFVCGEATALVASIEGNRGNPRQKPPHLSDYGLWKSPTVLNNVETLANIAPIIRNGGEWFKNIGTESSPGTKVFALTGHIQNTGLVEVPMGISLRELIYEVGGGLPQGVKLKAIQTGGPSGGCIPEELLDIPVDYESLKSIGSIMGSGGLIVMDESSNMVEVARFFMDFCQSESCGKCVPCRVGTTELTSLLDKFIAKNATQNDYKLLKELCEVVKNTSLCGLGQTAPNPVLSTIKYFEEEYLEGIKDA
ncbi:NuoF family protein [Halarcobacter ebronensis]|uniref:NADH-quinone oxidoreductase subunit L n=1 Tax=Halarcobacter ebronensis TaxID=1462615 RepID=A0A4Q1AQV3_9BACT|nr:NADH-ubiquinone oxidoreductase-F iron-sulfur binding region domain-containing protein [Halarcobacter ebronensis]QKF83227.1 bidirectional [Ni-Fe] hydrogenase complex, diaphorase protein HoxF [Halarcobacter ebronensis]RXK05137.1 NADH-quinone oxidoreductase subunit L [Halarcobacter ebronensis]